MKPTMVLAEVIAGLKELSDMETQQRLWVHGGADGISSFSEAICGIYDDGDVTRAMDAGTLDESLCVLFNELDALIAQIPEDITPEETINHPAMHGVRRVSRQLLRQLENMENRDSHLL